MSAVTDYRPSPLIRWPLYLMNGLLALTILALAGAAVLLGRLGETVPWALVGVGGGICLLLLLVNSSVAALRLAVEPGRVRLRVWPWRRSVPLTGATLRIRVRAVGPTEVRVIGADGRRIYINPAWFSGFDHALAEIEGHTRAAGGEVVEVRGS